MEIFTAENIAHVYGVDTLVRIADDGKPSIVPIRRIGNTSGNMEELTELIAGK